MACTAYIYDVNFHLKASPRASTLSVEPICMMNKGGPKTFPISSRYSVQPV
jgi:hypothetical protein